MFYSIDSFIEFIVIMAIPFGFGYYAKGQVPVLIVKIKDYLKLLHK